MITICTAIIDKSNGFLQAYEESIVEKLKNVTEVLLCKNDSPEDFYKEWQNQHVTFKKFGYKIPPPPPHYIFTQGCHHALSIHECINRATNPYLMFCDADIFFYSETDQLYLDLMHKHNLNCVGVSHTSAHTLAQKFFPWHGNLVVKKSELPGDDFLADKLLLKGKYLLMDAVDGTQHEFPNPKGNFDTGSYLCYWGLKNNWKWFSFQTVDAHTYTTDYYRGNVKIKNLPRGRKLLYHAVSGSLIPDQTLPNFLKAYEEST